MALVSRQRIFIDRHVPLNPEPDHNELIKVLFGTSALGGYASETVGDLCVQQATRCVFDAHSDIIAKCNTLDALVGVAQTRLLEQIRTSARHYFDVVRYLLGMHVPGSFRWEYYWIGVMDRVMRQISTLWNGWAARVDVQSQALAQGPENARRLQASLDRLIDGGYLIQHCAYEDWRVMLHKDGSIAVAKRPEGGRVARAFDVLDAYACARYFDCDFALVIADRCMGPQVKKLSRLLGVGVFSTDDVAEVGYAITDHKGAREKPRVWGDGKWIAN